MLSAAMINPDCWVTVASLEPDLFRAPQHQEWHAAIRSTPNPDVVSVCAWLKDQGLTECSMDYILRRMKDAPVNIERHIPILEDRALRRKITDRLESGIRLVASGEKPGLELSERLASDFLNLTLKGNEDTAAELGDILIEVVNELEEIQVTKQMSGIPTGFALLDSKTGGWQPGDQTIIAARPSEGKTALALQFSLTAAKAKKRVLFISREMRKKALGLRLLTGLANIEQYKARSGKLTDSDWGSIKGVLNRLLELGVVIDDQPYQTVASIRAKALRQRLTKGLDMVVIDYLQLLDEPKDSTETRATQVGRTSKGLKSLAQELAIPVLLCSQMSREYEKERRRPMLSDLRESGDIEQDADQVLFIHTPGDDKEADVHAVELILAKQRNGPTGTINAVFNKPKGLFTPPPRQTPPQTRDRMGEREHD